MPPIVCIVRHAQAAHNVTRDGSLHDPALTDLGIQQCADLQAHLRAHWPDADRVELIVASPMRRTLQTAQLAFAWLTDGDSDHRVPIMPRAEWQENCLDPCDTGSDLAAIAAEFADLDFSHVDPLWPAKTGPYAYTREAVVARARTARRWLKSRPEAVIAVVTHSAFLRTAVVHRKFANADYRVFRFAESGDSEANDADLVEEPWTARGAMGRSAAGRVGIEARDFRPAQAVPPPA